MKNFTLHDLPKEERSRERLKRVGVEQIIKKWQDVENHKPRNKKNFTNTFTFF